MQYFLRLCVLSLATTGAVEGFFGFARQSSMPKTKLAFSNWGGASKSSTGGSKGVLVVGATGRTGKRVVEVLQKKGQKVTAGVRSLGKGEELLGKPTGKLSFLEVDVQTESLETLTDKVAGYSAVVCATGYSPTMPPDLTGPYKVDYLGTVKLTEAIKAAGVPKLVLVTSLLTDGLAAGQAFNKNFLILNLFGGVLFAKNAAEKKVMKSGLDWTIVRPGGLRESAPEGQIKYGKANTIFGGSISRYSVAEVCVAALTSKAASNKVIEIIAEPEGRKLTFEEGFASI